MQMMNRRLTFRVAQHLNAQELGRDAAVTPASAATNFALYTLLVIAGVMPRLAVALATIALMALNFFGYKLFAFRLKP